MGADAPLVSITPLHLLDASPDDKQAGTRSAAVVPLMSHEGRIVGTLSASQQKR